MNYDGAAKGIGPFRPTSNCLADGLPDGLYVWYVLFKIKMAPSRFLNHKQVLWKYPLKKAQLGPEKSQFNQFDLIVVLDKSFEPESGEQSIEVYPLDWFHENCP